MSQKNLILLLIVQFLSVQLVFAQNRGVGVRVRNEQTNRDEEVRLYEGSFALVIGVSNYNNGWQKLPGVKNDLIAVSEALGKQGFVVEQLADPSSETLLAGINRFVNKYGLSANNRLLIYFAGHGYTEKAADGRQFGYVVPVDAPNPGKDLLAFQQTAVTMDDIETVARKIRSKHALFIFDSCFSGTLLNPRRSTVPFVITMKATQPVRQFITAGAANQEVPDVSIFRRQFVDGIGGEADRNGDGYITGSELADFLQEKVTNYTRGSQTPQYGKLFDPLLDKGDFVFVLPGPAGQPTVPTDPTGEAAFWKVIENSANAADFEDYLNRIRNREFAGTYKAAAELKLRKLKETPAPGDPSPRIAKLPNFEMIQVAAGKYWTGVTNNVPINIDKSFYLGKYEVTQDQWAAVMNGNPSNFTGCGNCPVEQVSWTDVQEFINKLNSLQKELKYRLPDEYEWEYACRAGETSRFNTGRNSISSDQANFGNSVGKTMPVNSYQPNNWGFFNMHGNVREWTANERAGYGGSRVTRGGGWIDRDVELVCRNRSSDQPSIRNYLIGFRLAADK